MVRILKTIYLVLLLVLAGCVLQSQVKISLVDRPVVDSSPATLSTVSVVNDQLVLSGAGLDRVTSIRLTGPSVDQTLSIESKNSGSLIANGTANLSLLVGGLFNLIISDASGAATYQVTFTLQNGAVTGSKISQMGAATGDVLGWNGTTWAPQPSVDSGLLFMGAWDAVSALPAGSAGEYYIAETSNYYDFGAGPEYVRAGDWALYAGASWTHVDKSSGVLKVFGRTGEVTAVEGDIPSLDLIGNVNTAGAANGKVLKYNGSAWVVGDDLVGAVGSIGSAEITDGSIADTDLAGSISQAKITNLVSDLAGKQATITAGTTAQFYRGDKSWQDFAATVLGTPITGYALGANTPISGTDTILAAFGKIQGQITSGYLSGVSSNIQTQLDSKLSVESDPSVYLFAKSQLPTCLPGEVLSESLGAFTCVTDAVGAASEWVTTGSDIYRSSGYVGIGTNAPTADLMINALSGSMHTITRLRNQASSAGAGLRLVFSHLTVDSAAISEQLIDGTNNSDLFFSTRGTNVLTEKMRITASGNVGIGSTTPTAKLDITGNIRIVDGTQGANKVLTSDTDGYASWQALPGGGDALTSGKLSQFAATSSAELAGVISDESGTGALLFAGSPAMTGTPTAPTAAGGTSTTQIATTAFVAGEVLAKQASDTTLTALAGYNTNGIMVQTAADTFTGRSVIGTLNRVSVTNGSGVLGDPTINIDPTLFPSPVAANLVLRSTGTDASTWQTLDTAMVNESASYLYFTEGRVLGTDLLGLSLASSADVTSADTVLSAIGKLQSKTDTLESNGQWLVNTTHVYRSSGNVGIGTATPSAMLTVNGNGLFGVNTTSATATPVNVSFGGTYGTNAAGSQANLKWDMYNAAGSNRYGIGMSAGLMEFQAGSNSDGNFAWYTGSATERMRLTTAGNLGIGTATPSGILHASKNGGGTYVDLVVQNTDNSTVAANQARMRLTAYGDLSQGVVFGKTSMNNASYGGNAYFWNTENSAFMFATNNTERLRLGASGGLSLGAAYLATDPGAGNMIVSGNVGIGTNAPSAKLEVAGQVKITGGTPGVGKVLTSDAAGLASWETPASGTVTSVTASGPISSSGGATPDITIARATTSTDGYLSSADWNTFNNKWVVNGTDVYRSSGNVGIGTDSPIRTLDVNGIIKSEAFQMFKDGSDVVGAGPYYGMYKADVTRGWLQQLSASNNMDFWYFNGAAWSQKMTLDSTGALGIGTASPGAKLEVAGQVKITGGTPGVGKVLTSDAAGLASWATPTSGTVTSVTASGPLSSSGGATPNITIAAATTSTDGYLSSTDWNAFNSKQGVLTNSAGLAGALSDETGTGFSVFSASPAFTGVPLAPTAAVDTNTTQLATTAFVVGQAGGTGPVMDGTQTVGTSLRYSREDHIHPSDTSRISKSGDTMTTGTFTFSTAAVLRTLDPIGLTDVANRQWVENSISSSKDWIVNGSNVYRSSGKVGIGTSTPTAALTINNGDISLVSDNNYTSFKADTYHDSYYSNVVLRTGRGTISAPTSPLAGDTLGALIYRSGTSSYNSTVIRSLASQNHTSSAFGTILAFSTTPDDNFAPQERMRISSEGYVGIGTSTPTNKLSVAGAVDITQTTATAAMIGAGIGVSNNPTNAVTPARTIGITSYANSNDVANPSQFVAGIDARALASNTSTTATELDGGYFSASLYATGGNVTSAYGVKGYAGVYSAAVTSGTVTTAASIYAMAPSSQGGGASITNAYSLLLDSPTTGTNNFSIYQNGTATNYFGGKVGIGTTAPSSLLQLESDLTTTLDIRSHKTTISEAAIKLIKTRGTTAAPTTVVNGDLLGSIYYSGYDGTTNKSAAIITSSVDGVVSTGIVPGRLVFGTANSINGALAEHMRIDSTGYVGIGTTNPSYKLDVQGGDINASGSVRAAGVALTSDQRFKRDIASIDDPVEKLLDLRGVTYYWRDQDFPERHFDNKLHYGFIAQEIEQVVPEVVNTDSKGFKSVEYANITSILVEGFKVVWEKILTLFEENREQDRAIASVKEENQRLKDENEKLKKRLDRIEKLLSK